MRSIPAKSSPGDIARMTTTHVKSICFGVRHGHGLRGLDYVTGLTITVATMSVVQNVCWTRRMVPPDKYADGTVGQTDRWTDARPLRYVFC